MNGPGFYGSRDRGHFGTATHCIQPTGYGNSSVGYADIPDQYTHCDGTEHSHWAQNSGSVALNQKLDRILGLIEAQRNESSELKTELGELKAKFQEVQEMAVIQKATQESQKLPKELSGMVKRLHTKSPPDLKFDAKERYASDQNQKVKHYLLDKLTAKYGAIHPPQYTNRQFKKAAHRYYESRRRIHNDSQPGRSAKAKRTKRNSKKTEKRKRAYATRRKWLKEREQLKWDQLDYRYMTEESSDSDDDLIHSHKLAWRSEELNKLVKKADERRAKKKADQQFISREKVEGAPSQLPIPVGAPDWSYKADWVIPRSDEVASSSTAQVTLSTASTQVMTTPQNSSKGQKSVPRQIFSDTESSSSADDEFSSDQEQCD